jgi:glycosyltransferase involved in cell wall biosynthesis
MPTASDTAPAPGAGASDGARHAPRVSVAIPLYNEEEVLPELLRRVRAVLDALPGGPHEIVVADDGSSDRTLAILEDEAAREARLVVVSLSRNFGHQQAFSAALDHATGDVVVMMDGDLQDAPEAIPRFLAEHARGYEVVYAVRARRKEPLLLRACYAAFYRVAASLADVALPVGSGDFSLVSRRVVDHMRASEERHRYLRGLRTWVGFKQIGIEVERAARGAGDPKYGWSDLFRLAFDGIFAFSVVPIRLASIVGAIAIALTFVYSVYALVVKLLFDRSPQGFTALFLGMAFISGVQLLFLGIIGEYVGRIYNEVKRRPLYVVDRVVRRAE